MITFEVHVRSDLSSCNPVSPDAPFPGCRFNKEENRWEYSAQYVTSLLALATDLGMPLTIRPYETVTGELPVLEVIDDE